MRHACRLYLWACRKWGPGGLTISAYAWKREQEGRGHHLREFIDDTFLCFFDQEDHCERQFNRETRVNPRA